MITAKASGGDVPAFTLSTPAPALLGLVSPMSTGLMLDVSTSQDFTLTWSGTSNDKVQVALFNLATPPSPEVVVECTFDASAGTGTVPVSLMSKLPKGQGEILATVSSIAQTTDDGWDVQLVATNPLIEGPIILQ
jgi:hypothetical protein